MMKNNTMTAIGIIPARMGSSRFPGKPLAEIQNMPMLGHCYHRTRLADGISSTYVATCDTEIVSYIESIGCTAIMTADSHTRATTRTAEALEHIEAATGEHIDVVVMVQGDEPLIPPSSIAETLKHFRDPDVEIVNIMARIREPEQFLDKNNVKVVVNQNNDALYFSRETIPSPWQGYEGVPMYMQTGIIAFRRDTLIHFNQLAETQLEQIESVDMNRILETGGRIRMVPTNAVTIGVDTPDELRAAEKIMSIDPIFKEYAKS
jgi:3-deoxy-manno-octulosonate cytidylyltransferase (CMP-KDO synthetase)